MLGAGGFLGNDPGQNARRRQEQAVPRVSEHATTQSPLGGVGPVSEAPRASTAGSGAVVGSERRPSNERPL